jgi:hypothetical protein
MKNITNLESVCRLNRSNKPQLVFHEFSITTINVDPSLHKQESAPFHPIKFHYLMFGKNPFDSVGQCQAEIRLINNDKFKINSVAQFRRAPSLNNRS